MPSIHTPASPRGVALAALLALAAAPLAPAPAQPAHHPDRVLVRFSGDLPEQAKGLFRRLVGARGVRRHGIVPGLESFRTSVGAAAAVRALTAQGGVLYAEPDYVVTHSGIPDDPDYSLLWGMDRIGAPAAWATTTGNDVVVAVIDEGIDVNHPDLAANIWSNPGEIPGNGIDDDQNGKVDDVHGWDFANQDASVYDGGDEDHHGTHVAGTIGAVGNDGFGIPGVNWSVKIMSLKFLGPQGGYTSDAIDALDYAVAMGARISNNSWGGGGYSSSLYDAIDRARQAGHVFVAAAGNDGRDLSHRKNAQRQSYPASYDLPNILSVAAIDQDDQIAWFSNYGDRAVDLAAPGTAIYSTLPGGAYGAYNGTSMATPHVAGACALFLAANPGASGPDIVAQILDTVAPLPSLAGNTVTGGLLDVGAALGPRNARPAVTITAPGDGTLVTLGTEVTFAGSASDAEDGDLSGSIAWASSVDGALGTGATLSTSALGAGTHFVTATVTDSGGRAATADTTLIVEDPTSDDGGGGGGGKGNGRGGKKSR